MPDTHSLFQSIDKLDPIDPRRGVERPQARSLTDLTAYDAKPLAGKTICLIDEQSFTRECIKIGLQISSNAYIRAYSAVSEFKQDKSENPSSIVLIASLGVAEDYCAHALDELLAIQPAPPVIILGPPRSELLNVAIAHGAKGYIPFTTKFEVVVEVMRVILAGGTYVPMDCLPNPVSREWGDNARESGSKAYAALTARELSVVRAIQLGKSNKAIAYALNMTESTVKAHVRNVMAKLNAKNRTEVAMMSEKTLSGSSDDLSAD